MMEFRPIWGLFILVSKTTSIIEINGNRYDAVTGQLIGAAKKAAHHIRKPISNLTIDGFTRPAKAIRKSALKRSVHSLQRKPQRSKTLMRSIVNRPGQAKAEGKIKSRGLSQDHARVSRAALVAKDNKVHRFGLLPFSRTSEAKIGEIVAGSSVSPHGRSAMQPPVHGSAATSVALPAVVSSASHHRLERLLDYALAHADAHKKALDKSSRARRMFFGRIPRWLVFSLIFISSAAIIGLVVWQKVPQASLRLAATQANVNASLPAPIDGYRIGPITAKENAVVTTMESTTDSSKIYIVTESAFSQPAASLEDDASVAAGSAKVQTVQDQDKTYILSQDEEIGTATCTKGSNTISVEGRLDVSQLLEAAKNACNN